MTTDTPPSIVEHHPIIVKKTDWDYSQSQRFRFYNIDIILNPSISFTNFLSLMLFSAYLGFILIPVNMLQLPLLRIIYNQDRSERDTTTTISQIFELLACLILSPIYGYLCDRYGRKLLIAYGIFLSCLATVMMPFLPSVYPYFYLTRLLFVNGYTAMVVVPFLADYIDVRTQGSVAGMINILGNLGAFLSTTLVQDRNLNETISSKFVQLGSESMFIGILILFGLKHGMYHKRGLDKHFESETHNLTANYSTLERTEDHEDSRQIMERDYNNAVGFKVSAKQNQNALMKLIDEIKEMNNVQLLVGYVHGFLGASQSCLLGFCLINYATSSFDNENAISQSYKLTNASILIGVFTSAIYGFFADTFSKFLLTIVTILFSATGVILMIWAFDPYSGYVYLAMVLFGLASSGYNILNSQLVSRHAHVMHRGAVNATNNIIWTLGAGVINIIGLYLSRTNSLIPFYMHAVFSIAGIFAVGYLFWTKYESIKKL